MNLEYEKKIPNIGDVAFKQNDWREEHPFIIIDVVKCEDKFVQITNTYNCRDVKTYNLYKIFGISQYDGLREFSFAGGKFINSRKVKKGSKKESYLVEKI